MCVGELLVGYLSFKYSQRSSVVREKTKRINPFSAASDMNGLNEPYLVMALVCSND